MRSKKTITVITMLLLSAALVFAASAESLYADFQTAVAASDVQAAIDAWDKLQDQIDDERQDAYKDIDKARDKNDRQLYASAAAELRRLNSYTITPEDSDALLTAMLNGDSVDDSHTAWLYENSASYHPVLTLSAQTNNEGYSQTYRRSFSMTPGSQITLPSSTNVSARHAGVLAGWGLTPDEVTYQPGQTISMPATDQTLYAVFTNEVTFTDGDNVTSVTDVAEGDVISVPAPSVPEGAIFDGWYDEYSGLYLAPDETSYTVQGSGASFRALYISAEASELSSGNYSTDSIPSNVQIPLSAALVNTGTEDLHDVSVTVTSDSQYARLLNTNAFLRSFPAGGSVTMRGTQLVVSADCPSGTAIPVTVTMTDNEGNSFTSSFTLTAR